jgi:hypothetical protein
VAVHPVIGRCPICQHELAVTRLHCRACGSTIEGAFNLGPLQRLSREQINFVETLILARGSLKEVGAALNMSYPTVNNRLNDILIALGHGDRVKTSDPPEPNPGISRDQRREILTQVREGKLSADEAQELLRGQQ